jgi:hypothetical protein
MPQAPGFIFNPYLIEKKGGKHETENKRTVKVFYNCIPKA